MFLKGVASKRDVVSVRGSQHGVCEKLRQIQRAKHRRANLHLNLLAPQLRQFVQVRHRTRREMLL